jgi:hypothetical protein
MDNMATVQTKKIVNDKKSMSKAEIRRLVGDTIKQNPIVFKRLAEI